MRSRALMRFALVALAASQGDCDGQDNPYDYGEPILVHGAQFFAGELPGTLAPDAAVDAGVPGGDAGLTSASPPVVTSIQSLNTTVFSGEAGKQISGRTTNNASAVGIRLGELGTGYWILPLGNPDPQFPGELTWSAIVDFNPTITPGLQALRVVAVTSTGVTGVQSDQNFCLASRLPADPGAPYTNDISACNPSLNPPEAVFSLTWDANVDLDLHVITPAGNDVNPKSPLLTPVDAGGVPALGAPRIDRDSMALCVPDGWREEDLAFPTLPAPGSTFQIYANLFEACGLPEVTFSLTVYQATGTPGAGRHLVQAFQRSGRLTAFDADGDATGLFIVSYPF